MSRKICVVTGTRAEYGLLRWVMEGIRETPGIELQIIVTGMHLSPEFGLTYREIEKDGFRIDRKLEMLLSSEGYRVELAANATQGLKCVEASAFDLILLDLMMPDKSGMEVLEEIRGRDRETPIFLITAYGSVETAVTALKRGAIFRRMS